MALEKTKIDKIQIPENIKKTKRNRHKTECSINRMKGCGNCGSRDVIIQGVKFCNICNNEIEFLTEDDWIWNYTQIEVPCTCTKIRINHKGKKITYRDTNMIYVTKCIVCGSIKSNFCPNCKNRNCWKSWDGKKFCQNCGYRSV